ncbi:unnamed protein product [Brassica oleracea]|uniref:Uncharacterized protein n=2 Tax=Brassica TaxID=3705 RepID=A0A0D3BUS8_BRAOL|nr:unnamed protein product [Brassica napus]
MMLLISVSLVLWIILTEYTLLLSLTIFSLSVLWFSRYDLSFPFFFFNMIDRSE